MKSKLQKLKEYEINKSEQKNINGGLIWDCSMPDVGSTHVRRSSQVKALQARGYRCTRVYLRYMLVLG